jgi:4-amino-4-deoxy-L-arabinose transferase-like glycosyltransferase
MRISRNLRIGLLVLILTLAALIRVYNINKESFWADEGWTMILAKGPGLSDIVQTMANDQHPPLYFALLHSWMTFTGESEVTIRLLSTFWSLVGIAALYRLGADVYAPEVGTIAALLLALTDNDTYLSQEARHYTQMAALAVLATLFYFRYLKAIGVFPRSASNARKARTYGLLWVGTTIALMYTHYLGAFIILIQLLHSLIVVRPVRRLFDVLFRWAAIGAAWLPWAFVFINQGMVRYTRPILFQSTYPNTPEAFAILRGDTLGSHFALTIGLIALGLIYITYSSGKLRATLRPIAPTLYAAAWLLLPPVVMIAVNPRFPILTPRNFLIIMPVIALLVAHGLSNLDRYARLFLLIVIVALDLFTVDAYFIKPPYRQVAQDMLNYRTGDAMPLLLDVWTDTFALRYHLGRDLHADPDTLPLLLLPVMRESAGPNYYVGLLNDLKDKDSFLLAYWGKPDDPDFGFFKDHGFVRTAETFEKHLDVNTIYIYRYDRVGGASLATFGKLFDLRQVWVPTGTYHPGDSVRINALWSAEAHPDKDYSISLYFVNTDGSTIVQHDSPPIGAPSSAWVQGEPHFDSESLTLPPNLAAGTYTLRVKIYWYGDGVPLPVNGGTAFDAGKIVVTAP